MLGNSIVTPERVASYFGVELIDHGADRGRGVLLASGAGLMMATMDACPPLRWCADLDRIRHATHRIPMLAVALDNHRDVHAIALAGWFSLDDPLPFYDAMARIRHSKRFIYLVTPNGGDGASLGDFIGAVNSYARTPNSLR